MKNKKTYVFYLCHGIRTPKKEIERLVGHFTDQLNKYYEGKNNFNVEVFDGSYGYVSWFSNILPPLRRVLQYKTQQDLESISKRENTEIILVTYSFGTYITSEIFKEVSLNVHSWVLFGAVVHCRYSFYEMRTAIKKRVLNFCSLEDEIAKYIPLFFGFITGYGNSGHYGFRYQNGQKSISETEGKELVWVDPKVYNIHHNLEEHSGEHGWFDDEKYIIEMFDMLELR